MGDDTTNPPRGEGLSTSLKCLMHSVWAHSRPESREECCGQTSTTPGLKVRASILLQAPSAELAASLGMVTRCVPRGALRDTEACSEAFHGQGHPSLTLGQTELPGTTSALTLAQTTSQVQPKSKPKKTLGQAPNPGPRDPGPNSDPGPKEPQTQLRSLLKQFQAQPKHKHGEACNPTVTPCPSDPRPQP